MRQDYMEWAYETMAHFLKEGHRMPGVENAFAQGSYCLECYHDIYAVHRRLCARLGSGEEDADVEIIINSFWDIQRELCYRMYRCGAVYGMGSSK